MTDPGSPAPGWPGIEPRWTSSAKSAVGTAMGEGSRVWFTASHGILNEIYYPEVDTACLRDAGFIVTAEGFLSEEKRHCTHAVEWLAAGVPAFRMQNDCNAGRYLIEKRICTSSEYDVVLQHVRFTPRVGTLADYTLTLLLSPHLNNHGAGNTGWIGQHKGEGLLFARRDGYALAVASTTEWVRRTAGYAGPNDAWHDLQATGRLTRIHDRAENGNIALAGEIDLQACGGEFVIAIGFGGDPNTAAFHARAALTEPYEVVERRYASPWRAWQERLVALDEPAGTTAPHVYRPSTAVMRSHLSMNCDGGAIASLSVPWGSSKGDGDLGGYHLVWPRDMVETAGGLLAAGAHDDMKGMLRFLAVTQEHDGRWPQNMWLNGTAFWTGVQLDETAFPILLVDLALREGALGPDEAEAWRDMVHRAAVYVAMQGPVTEQDRWEEDAGYSPFTLAVGIAALLAAADLVDRSGDPDLGAWLRDTADDWNASIEQWTYVAGTPLAKRCGVRGYYVRIGSREAAAAAAPPRGFIEVKNRGGKLARMPAAELVCVDALALVRFGLRAANDPRMTDTVRVIDALLRTDTRNGPTWRRYNEDGYGEHEDGSPFDGSGIGRGWPLLAGERAHYELAAGRVAEAERLADAMRRQSGPGGFLPEQVWDAADIPEFELYNGCPAGSAMPLVWAHAEYVKLLRSLRDGRTFDCPPQTTARYVTHANVPRVATWGFTFERPAILAGLTLRIDLSHPARVRWTSDNWATHVEVVTTAIAPRAFSAELDTAALPAGPGVEFTFFWLETGTWEGKNFQVRIGNPGGNSP